VAATGGEKARLTANTESDHWFGVIVGQTKIPMKDSSGNPVGDGINVPIVNVVQTIKPNPNTVADRVPAGS
jgi:hypothetical protein